MLDQAVAEELHQKLLEEQDRLQGTLDGLRGGSELGPTFLEDEQDTVDQHPADEGSELFEREKNMALDREIEASLEQVQEALARFDAGTYGTCARCGKPIPVKRLQAMPEALYDVECQAIIEREQEARYHGARNP